MWRRMMGFHNPPVMRGSAKKSKDKKELRYRIYKIRKINLIYLRNTVCIATTISNNVAAYNGFALPTCDEGVPSQAKLPNFM